MLYEVITQEYEIEQPQRCADGHGDGEVVVDDVEGKHLCQRADHRRKDRDEVLHEQVLNLRVV